MIPTLEERVTDLEKLYTDLPEIMNLRFSRVETALRENATRFDEIAGRLNLLDTQMGMMIRDMRDLRGGVTRQLVGQDDAADGGRDPSRSFGDTHGDAADAHRRKARRDPGAAADLTATLDFP